MDLKVKFFFYLASVVCFVLAAIPARTRRVATVSLLPLGLALFVFPTLWDTGVAAF